MTRKEGRHSLDAPSVSSPLTLSVSRRQVVAAVAALVLIGGGLAFWTLGTNNSEPTRSTGPTERPEVSSVTLTPAVARAAEKVLVTWSEPDLGYGRWWRQLRPLLTPSAREAYAYTDPRRLPELGDVEQRDLVAGSSRHTATVWFTSSSGRYGVDLSRRRADAPWRAVRILFPGQESMFR